MSIVKTKRPAVGPAFSGGVSSWAKLAGEIRKLLNSSDLRVLTTMLDYYGLLADTPGMATRPDGSPHERVAHVERCLVDHFGDERFLPHLILHELETGVLAAADQLAELYGDQRLAEKLRRGIELAGGPELVNDGPATAPSKRLLSHLPGYVKTLDGPLAIGELGVAQLRGACPHADAWFARLLDR